jgi:DNA-binding transcriptional LysR family regulator
MLFETHQQGRHPTPVGQTRSAQTRVILADVDQLHHLMRNTHIRQADLADAPVLRLEDGHCMRDQALAVCGIPQLSGTEDVRASSLETLCQLEKCSGSMAYLEGKPNNNRRKGKKT